MRHVQRLSLAIVFAALITQLAFPAQLLAATVSQRADDVSGSGAAQLAPDNKHRQQQQRGTVTVYPAGTSSTARGGDTVSIAATDICTDVPNQVPCLGPDGKIKPEQLPPSATSTVTSTATGSTTAILYGENGISFRYVQSSTWTETGTETGTQSRTETATQPGATSTTNTVTETTTSTETITETESSTSGVGTGTGTTTSTANTSSSLATGTMTRGATWSRTLTASVTATGTTTFTNAAAAGVTGTFYATSTADLTSTATVPITVTVTSSSTDGTTASATTVSTGTNTQIGGSTLEGSGITRPSDTYTHLTISTATGANVTITRSYSSTSTGTASYVTTYTFTNTLSATATGTASASWTFPATWTRSQTSTNTNTAPETITATNTVTNSFTDTVTNTVVTASGTNTTTLTGTSSPVSSGPTITNLAELYVSDGLALKVNSDTSTATSTSGLVGKGLLLSAPGLVQTTDSRLGTATGTAICSTGMQCLTGTGTGTATSTWTATVTGWTPGTVVLVKATGTQTNTATFTGSGTTNVIPKFTGTLALGNSQLSDNGSAVSINTSDTTLRLNVGGGIHFPSNIGWPGVTAKGVWQQANYGLVLQGAGTTYDMSLVSSAGNIAFGVLTGSPNAHFPGKISIGTTGTTYLANMGGILGWDANISYPGANIRGLWSQSNYGMVLQGSGTTSDVLITARDGSGGLTVTTADVASAKQFTAPKLKLSGATSGYAAWKAAAVAGAVELTMPASIGTVGFLKVAADGVTSVAMPTASDVGALAPNGQSCTGSNYFNAANGQITSCASQPYVQSDTFTSGRVPVFTSSSIRLINNGTLRDDGTKVGVGATGFEKLSVGDFFGVHDGGDKLLAFGWSPTTGLATKAGKPWALRWDPDNGTLGAETDQTARAVGAAVSMTRTFKFPTTAGSSGNVLYNTGSGQAAWGGLSSIGVNSAYVIRAITTVNNNSECVSTNTGWVTCQTYAAAYSANAGTAQIVVNGTVFVAGADNGCRFRMVDGSGTQVSYSGYHEVMSGTSGVSQRGSEFNAAVYSDVPGGSTRYFAWQMQSSGTHVCRVPPDNMTMIITTYGP